MLCTPSSEVKTNPILGGDSWRVASKALISYSINAMAMKRELFIKLWVQKWKIWHHITYDKQPLSWIKFLPMNYRCLSFHLVAIFGGKNRDNSMINLT